MSALVIVQIIGLFFLYLGIQRFFSSSTFLRKDPYKNWHYNDIGITARRELKYGAGPSNTSKLIVNICTKEFKDAHFMTWAPVSLSKTGNRLFQLATLIATAKTVCYTPVVHHQEIKYIDEIFELQNVKRIDLDMIYFRSLREDGAGIYDVNLTSKIDSAYNWTLTGFRQSFKYFEKFSEFIRSSFKIKEKIREDVLRYMCLFEKDQVKVGLHVRRGNIARPENQGMGYKLSDLDYINRSIAYVKTRIGQSAKAFIVVSDDIKWCKQNIKGPEIHYSPFHDPGRDLYLLTQCDHNIFTSGTFGWMGAWLNETGLVVYDKSHPRYNSKLWYMTVKDDYYPSRWTGM